MLSWKKFVILKILGILDTARIMCTTWRFRVIFGYVVTAFLVVVVVIMLFLTGLSLVGVTEFF